MGVQMVRQRREGAHARDAPACAVFAVWSQIVTRPDRLRAPCKTHLGESLYQVPPTSIPKIVCSVFEWQPVVQLPSSICHDGIQIHLVAGKRAHTVAANDTRRYRRSPIPTRPDRMHSHTGRAGGLKPGNVKYRRQFWQCVRAEY